MSGEQSNYFMDNDPAVMDQDSPEFQAALKAFDTDEEQASAGTEQSTDKQGEEGASPGAAATTGENDGKVEGVLTADGKHIIPFEVFRATREQAAQYRQAAEEAAARIKALEDQLQAKPGDKIEVDVDDGSEQTDEIAEKLKQLGEDFPEFGEVASALMSKVTALQSEVTNLRATAQEGEARAVQQQRSSVEEAIASNASLVLWQADDPKAYERAVEFDKMLRTRDEWVGKPLAERFERVVALVRADYPEAKTPTPITSKKESQTDINDRVDAALKAAGDYVPESLTHIPGGKAPASNEGKFDDVTDMEAFFENATQEKIDAYLARFG